ncbi:MAG: 16S rRNA (adenine(1518)-N(6)/adenine(1519)-N(6))-dimethyltransferase RsmA, partial [Muribaculaceae bacterium]|nr:16S rRNA (adenine(1518)-N(6)/adenine(1519)-N(6))-dimethyltransferase RsmA [Muribaculaceae bacterium]
RTAACGELRGEEWGRLPVMEIGPGMGVLTDFLIAAGRDVTAIEIDSESVDYLHRYKSGIKVVEGDFLRLDLNTVIDGEFALIGNYPYNISSQIFFKALDYRDRIPVIAGMLQKEVAERICSGPGSKAYGILSVLLQVWYDCEYLFTVEPGVFSPPPKVRSGVLRLTRNSRTALEVDEKKFKTVVKTAFGMRRKTLRNSLAGMLQTGSPLLDDPILKMRPEQLSVEDFIRLVGLL